MFATLQSQPPLQTLVLSLVLIVTALKHNCVHLILNEDRASVVRLNSL